MIVKVCGISSIDNQSEIISSLPDMVGYNFYTPSKRYVIPDIAHELSWQLTPSVKSVGVFVNQEIESIDRINSTVGLDYIQLHGDEDQEYIDLLKEKHIVIKAFGVSSKEDFNNINTITGCEYFIFDTKTMLYGGSGKKFDWSLLAEYKGNTPFLLSGGISPMDTEELKSLQHPQFVGVDINSRFEITPGIKDPDLVKSFIQELKN